MPEINETEVELSCTSSRAASVETEADILIVNTDGGCNPNPGPGSFAMVVSANGKLVHRLSKAIGPATNNIAEWHGAIAALAYLALSRPNRAELRMDSLLVVNQLTRRWKVRDPDLKPLAAEGWQLLDQVRAGGTAIKVLWVPREENSEADRLAGEALLNKP